MASPMVTLQGWIVTMIMGALKDQDVVVADAPNAFMQAKSPETDGGDHVIVKTTGPLVDVSIRMNPDLHGQCIVCENRKKVM